MDRPRKVQLYFAGPVCYILLRRAVFNFFLLKLLDFAPTCVKRRL